jgi:hypothetical protein
MGMSESKPPSALEGCLAGGAGFIVGFFVAGCVIGFGVGMLTMSFSQSDHIAGWVMLAAAALVLTLSIIFLRRHPGPLLQGALIGASVISVMLGLCGAMLTQGD